MSAMGYEELKGALGYSPVLPLAPSQKLIASYWGQSKILMKFQNSIWKKNKKLMKRPNKTVVKGQIYMKYSQKMRSKDHKIVHTQVENHC